MASSSWLKPVEKPAEPPGLKALRLAAGSFGQSHCVRPGFDGCQIVIYNLIDKIITCLYHTLIY
jgi:hypothetical protein